jgi:hypothetical protein
VPTIRKQRPLKNNLMMHLKLLEKQEQSKLKTSRWGEIMEIMSEINIIDPNKLYKESMRQNFAFLKRLARLTNPQPT